MIFQLLLVARWVHFGSVFILFGSALFWFYAGPDGWKTQRPSPRSASATHRLLCAAAPIAALSGLAWLAAMLANMTSEDGAVDWRGLMEFESWRLFFFETGFGAVWLIRLGLLAASLYGAARWGGRAFAAALVPIGAALLVSQAWLGHAAQGDGRAGAAMIAAYGVHVLAAAAWVGGLPPLLFVLAERQRTGKADAAETLSTVVRFSAMGMAAVAAIVVTGGANAGFRGGASFWALLHTAWGGILCVKLALFALMLALALFNRFVALPRLRGLPAGRPAAAAALYGSVVVELALGAAVVGAAALLGLTPPPQ
jgi:putative copper resistance protein D